MFKKNYWILFLCTVFSIQAQERIKLMSYNLMHYPSTYVYDDTSNSFVSRDATLKLILDEAQPDLFMVCELENSTGADAILNNVLNVGTSKYAKPTFQYNQSSTYTGLNQFVYYNTEKLILDNQSILTTDVRDINSYTFILNTLDKDTNPIYLEVFVTHLKASDTTVDEQKRLDMVNVFTSNLANIPSSHHIVFAGDFNFYMNSESGYQEIIDATNAIVMKDPIDQEGSWHINSLYADVHTQSPLTTNTHFSANYGSDGAGSDGVTGGLDDRFDFIMLDQNTLTSTELHYVTGSYSAFGNNGTCFNDNIDDTNCAGTAYSQTTRDNLANMSDHLPVVMELETSQTFLAVDEVAQLGLPFGNIVSDELVLNNIDFNIDKYTIYNSLGQVIQSERLINDSKIIIPVASLDNGLYFLKIANYKIVKFIKTD